jgi:fumarate hydratase subunit beta
MIGKGHRDSSVVEAMKKAGAVYFAATGGAGALLSKCILEAQVIAWEDLGTEALRRLVVKDMPLTVIIDSQGKNLYFDGPRQWRCQRGLDK